MLGNAAIGYYSEAIHHLSPQVSIYFLRFHNMSVASIDLHTWPIYHSRIEPKT